jgi:hypothetical protein
VSCVWLCCCRLEILLLDCDSMVSMVRCSFFNGDNESKALSAFVASLPHIPRVVGPVSNEANESFSRGLTYSHKVIQYN